MLVDKMNMFSKLSEIKRKICNFSKVLRTVFDYV